MAALTLCVSLGLDILAVAVGLVFALFEGGMPMLGLSVSLNELAAGFPLGVRCVPLGLPRAVIAGQAFVVTFLGLASPVNQATGSRLRL